MQVIETLGIKQRDECMVCGPIQLQRNAQGHNQRIFHRPTLLRVPLSLFVHNAFQFHSLILKHTQPVSKSPRVVVVRGPPLGRMRKRLLTP